MIYQETGAVFSNCWAYRYLLWRAWDETAPRVLFVGLNPSIAGACEDDRTVKRCIGFATRAGYGGFYLTNLFGLISTATSGLVTSTAPEGNPDNDVYIHKAAARCAAVIAAWGDLGTHRGRDSVVLPLLRGYFPSVHCLTKTASGNPGHPLYLKSSCTPILFP